MSKLLRNELVKIWKQIGFRIIIILLIVTFTLTPFISYFTNSMSLTETENVSIEVDYKNALKEQKAFGNSSEVKYENKIRADAIVFFNTYYGEWRYQLYFYQYFNIYKYVAGYEDYIANKVAISDTIYSSLINKDNIEYLYRTKVEELNRLKSEIEALTIDVLYDKLISETRAYYERMNTEYEIAKSDQTVEYKGDALKAYELKIDVWKNVYETFVFLKDRGVEPLLWVTQLINMGYSVTNDINYNYPSLTEEEYDSYYLDGAYDNYYFKGMAAVNGSLENFYNYNYAVRNNIVIDSISTTGKISHKDVLKSAYISIESLFWFILAIIGSSLIAKEFSSGTARMLLIRPVKRSSIMTSKILALLIIYAGITIIGAILQALVIMIFYGVGNIFTSEVIYIFGKSVGVPFIFGYLKVYVQKLFITLFYTFIGITFACITKKTVVSVLIVYGIHSGMGILANAYSLINQFVPKCPYWLIYTPLPFLEGVGSNGQLIESILELLGMGVKYSYGYFYSWLGVLYYMIYTAIMVLLAYKAFKKAEVKS